jgi:hypothetical protein
MDELIDELDLPGLIKEHCGTTNANRRGNFQKHFGSSGSQNVGLPENDTMTKRYFGATYPRNNKRSHSQGVIRAQEVGTEIGKLMNIDFCQDDYLDHHPQHQRYFDFVSTMAGTNRAKFCSFSLTVLPLTMASKVNRHTDKENCPQFTVSMIVAENVYCPLQRIWKRVTAIFYMRKATFDMCVRVSACEEAAKCSMKWVARAEKYQRPTKVPILDVPLYHKNVGAEGMYITVDGSTNQIVSIALRSKACAEKQGNFLAPMVCSLWSLMEHNSVHFPTEFIELISVIGHLCSVYIFVTVLNMMQSDWDHEKSKHQKGGLVEYIFDRMKEITGCVSGGPGRRCMNFLNRNFPVRDIRSNCLTYRHLIATLLSRNQKTLTVKQKKEEVHKTTKQLARQVKWAGVFSVIHVVQTLALLGIAPSHFLDFVLISTGTSQHKKKNEPKVGNKK